MSRADDSFELTDDMLGALEFCSVPAPPSEEFSSEETDNAELTSEELSSEELSSEEPIEWYIWAVAIPLAIMCAPFTIVGNVITNIHARYCEHREKLAIIRNSALHDTPRNSAVHINTGNQSAGNQYAIDNHLPATVQCAIIRAQSSERIAENKLIAQLERDNAKIRKRLDNM